MPPFNRPLPWPFGWRLLFHCLVLGLSLPALWPATALPLHFTDLSLAFSLALALSLAFHCFFLGLSLRFTAFLSAFHCLFDWPLPFNAFSLAFRCSSTDFSCVSTAFRCVPMKHTGCYPNPKSDDEIR